MDRVARDAHVEVALLGALGGGVGHVSGITKIFEALPVGLLHVGVVFGEIERSAELVLGVEFAFLSLPLFGFPFLFTIVPFTVSFADDADVATKNWLAKHVVGADGQISVLAREIEGLVCDDVHSERGKFVPGNADELVSLQLPAVGVSGNVGGDAVAA